MTNQQTSELDKAKYKYHIAKLEKEYVGLLKEAKARIEEQDQKIIVLKQKCQLLTAFHNRAIEISKINNLNILDDPEIKQNIARANQMVAQSKLVRLRRNDYC